MDIAPRDFAMILRLLHIDLSSRLVLLANARRCRSRCSLRDRANSAMVGAAAADLRLYYRDKLDASIGPATEDATYAVIAPPLAFSLVQAFQQKIDTWMRVLLSASYAILLLGLILNAFFGLKKPRP